MPDKTLASEHFYTVEELRGLVAVHVANKTIRAVAMEIGMSAKQIGKFLRGSSPYGPNRGRLRSWAPQAEAACRAGFTQRERAEASR